MISNSFFKSARLAIVIAVSTNITAFAAPTLQNGYDQAILGLSSSDILRR